MTAAVALADEAVGTGDEAGAEAGEVRLEHSSVEHQ